MTDIPAPDAPERLDPPDMEGTPSKTAFILPAEGNIDAARAAPEPLVDMTEDMRLHNKPEPVTRLSKKAIIGLCAGTALLFGGAVGFALSDRKPDAKPNLVETNNVRRPESLNGLPKDYTGPVLGRPLPGDFGGLLLDQANREAGLDGLPKDQVQTGQAPLPPDPRIERAVQEREAARESQIFFAQGEQRTAPAAIVPVATTLSTEPDTTATAAAPSAAPSSAARRQAFLDRPSDTRFESAERLSSPASANTLQAGSVIAAALITGLRSDLPGQVTAQVTQNVYDSLTGTTLLIPQGSRLIGQYDAEISFGQSRALLVWNRLILPNGRSIILDRQPGTDAQGAAGLSGKVNNHWGNVARAAVLSTILGIGAELGSGSNNDIARAIRDGAQGTINEAGQRIVSRQLDVPTTITIRPGTPVRVMVTMDLVLEAVEQ